MTSPPGSNRSGLLRVNTVILGAFVLFFLTKLIHWLPRDLGGSGTDEWVYTDWLIDYSAGFVRRGLTGELVRLLSTVAPPIVVVGLLSWGLCCAVASVYLRLVGRSLDKLNPVLLFGLLFLPSLLPFYLHDHGALGRKEMIGFLILAWHLHLLSRRKTADARSYLQSLLPIGVFALPIHLFIHEASFFQFLPVHLLISYSIIRLDSSVSFPWRMRALALLYSPVFLACLIVTRFGRPSFEVALAICRHWESLGALRPGSSDVAGKDLAWALPGALTALPWSLSQAAAMSGALPRRVIFYWVWLFSVLGFFTAWIGSMVTATLARDQPTRALDSHAFAEAPSRRLCRKYFILPVCASLPLYFLGWDFGRWFAVTCFNYVLVTLSKEVLDAELPFINPPAVRPEQAAGASGTPAFPFWFSLKLAALLFSVFFLRLPRFNNEGTNMFVWPFDSLFLKLFGLLHRYSGFRMH